MTAVAQRLQEQHQGYARALALEIARKLPLHVEREELVSLAYEGLAEAAKRYDPQRGIPFETFAYRRIRGRVFDGLRKISGLPPRARRDITMAAGLDDVADHAMRGVTAATEAETQSARLLQVVRQHGAVFLASQLGPADAPDATENAEDRDADAPAAAELRERRERLVRALASLPDDAREVIDTLYVKGVSMTDWAGALGVNKSTVSRRHHKAIELLCEAMGVPPP